MFERIKTFFTGVKYIWTYGPVITSMLKYFSTYPGYDDSDKLRTWLRPVILDLSVLTSMSKSTIDDKISLAAIHIIDSDHAWSAVHSLILLANDQSQKDGAIKIENYELRDNANETYLDIANEIQAENPAIIIAAIGLIIQLIQLLRK
jgi:hypothetical protein